MSNMKPEQEAFLVLRPACVEVAQQPTIAALNNLTALLRSRCWPNVPELAEYCFFPIVKRLKESKLDESTLICCVKCLDTGLKAFRGALRSRVFHDILTRLAILLASKDDVSSPSVLKRQLAEEEKLVLVSCIQSLFVLCGSFVLELLSPSRLPALGHATALLLELAEKEKNRALRTSSMLALDCLFSATRCLQSDMPSVLSDAGLECRFAVQFASDSAVNSRCAFCLAHFLPGIASGLGKVMLGEEKQGQKVTQAAIYLWTSSVAFVLNDRFCPSSQQDILKQSGSKEKKKLPAQDDRTTRDDSRTLPTVDYSHESWWKTASTQVHGLLTQLSRLQSHPQWKVRLFVARMASTLLQHCSRSLSSSVTVLVEMLVALFADPYLQVAEVARSALAEFSKQINTASISLVSLLEEGIYRISTTLPSVLRGTDDRQKLSAVLLLQGYIQLLGPRLTTLLASPSLVQRLFHAILMALEMDASHASISISHSATVDGDKAMRVADIHLQRTPLTFKHFRDEAITKALQLCCSLLGYYGDLSGILDSLLDILLLHAHLNKQVVLMINTVISGAAGLGLEAVSQLQEHKKDENFEQHVRFLLSEYTQSTVWQVPTEQPIVHSNQSQSLLHPQDEHQSWQSRLLVVSSPDAISTRSMSEEKASPSLSAEELRGNVVLVCLLLDGVKVFAKVLGEPFRQFLLQALFPVLEKSGHDNLRIRDAAYDCLQTISTSCEYRSVSHLIGANADYLLNLCTQHLRVLHQHTIAARVMRETLANSDITLLPLLNAFLDEVLFVLERSAATGDVLVLVPVLGAAVCAVQRWTASDPRSADSQTQHEGSNGSGKFFAKSSLSRPTDREATSAEDIKAFFVDYHRKKKQEAEEAAAEQAELENGDTGAEDNTREDMEADVPKKLSDADNIGARVLTYCVNLLSVADVRSRLVLLDAVEQGILSLRHNQEQLLPLVHQLWSPLLFRVRDNNLPIATRAVKIIAVMSECTGNFIRSRLMSDVIPVFLKVLRQPVPAKYSQLHSLLICVFSTLGTACSQLGLPEKDIVKLSNLCVGYLSCKLPLSVQQAAVKLFKQWAECYGDCIWFLLVHLTADGPHSQPPHPCFAPVKLLTTVNNRAATDLRVNVEEILQTLR